MVRLLDSVCAHPGRRCCGVLSGLPHLATKTRAPRICDRAVPASGN